MTGSWAPHWKFRSHWKFPHWRRTSPESAPQSRWRPEKASATPVRPLNTGRLNILVCAHWICQNRLLRQQNEHEKVWRHCLHWEVVYADYELGPILCHLGKWNSEIDALICNKAKLQSKYIRAPPTCITYDAIDQAYLEARKRIQSLSGQVSARPLLHMSD
ncbi:unnamed protein product, partial [Nesidiocoris tenuis]